MEKYHASLQVKVYSVAHLMLRREQDFFKVYDITQKQFNILRILRGVYPNSASLKEVGERMIAPSSDITRLTSRLVKKELIEISVNNIDKRYKNASITKQGMSLLAQIDVVAFKNMKTGIQHLTKEECDTLSKLLDKIADDDTLANT
jgi:DNA-binding MarR family transcriptional regulator